MPTTRFIAGPYVGYYDLEYVGITERGFELEYQFHEQQVQGDILGDSIIDAIYLGGDVHFNFVLQEARRNVVRRMAWPIALSGVVADEGRIGRVGRTFVDLAKTFTLIAAPGTRAAIEGPLTLTAPYAILAGGQNVNVLFGSRHRNIPIRLRLYPYATTTAEIYELDRWFETT